MNILPEGVNYNKDITYLAKTNFRNQFQVFGIKRRDRRQHVYVLGKSGTGKSALLANMIVQNIANGEGLAVVDPHGELVESVLATIPPERVKDVIYFNPADQDYHIGFNVLQIADPKYKHLVASGLMGIFTKIWANAWSARMEYILNNCILALLDTPGSTLLGIPRLLVDKDYRAEILSNVKDPVLRSFWINEYETWRDQYRNEAIAPIQNKVGQFLSTAMVRNVLGQSESTIDIFDAMNSGKIFLVNVSKGRIGEDNSALLGGMLITKMQLAAMERVRIPEDQRKDFYLYVDEFQNFVTESFASILSEARKYRLNLTIAHQYIAQLVTKDSDSVRDAVFGNVGTMIVFRIGAADAEFLEKEFEPEFEIEDLVNLPNYNAYLKLMVDGITSRPFSALTLPPFKVVADSNVEEQIIESSRRLYAKPREDVEKEISAWSGMMEKVRPTGDGASAGKDKDKEGEGKFKAICSSCGKETFVPFEPEPGRPVYCRDCIAKIKSGELKPVRAPKPVEKPAEKPAEVVAETPAPAVVENPTPTPLPAPTPAPQPEPVVQQAAAVPEPVIVAQPQPQQSELIPQAQPESVSQPAPAPVAAPAPVQQSVTQASAPAPVVTLRTAPTPALRPVTQTPRPAAPAPRPVASAPRPATPAPRPAPKAPILQKEDGIKNILKNALEEALKKGDEYQQKKNAEIPEAPVSTPTVSLSSLRKPAHTENTPSASNSTQSSFASKEASAGKVSALAEAIARARASGPVVDPTPAVDPAQKTEPAPQARKSQSDQESQAEAQTPKKIREVPEDILRSVLE